jgi:hypothetical protein
MSACKVDRERPVKAVVPPETRERIRQMISTLNDKDDGGNDLNKLELTTLMLGEVLWVERSTSAVFHDGRIYIASNYDYAMELWIVEPSTIRSMTRPSAVLHRIARTYLKMEAGTQASEDEFFDEEMSILEYMFRAAICRYLIYGDSSDRPQILINIDGRFFVANHDRVIASFDPSNILYL